MLLSPPNNSTNQSLTSVLVWKQGDDANSYHIQLSLNSNFSVLLIDSAGVKTTSLPLNILQPGIVYYWRVLALNAVDSGPWSEVWNFTTTSSVKPAPDKPFLIAPSDKTIFSDILPYRFSWHTALNATSYQITI